MQVNPISNGHCWRWDLFFVSGKGGVFTYYTRGAPTQQKTPRCRPYPFSQIPPGAGGFKYPIFEIPDPALASHTELMGGLRLLASNRPAKIQTGPIPAGLILLRPLVTSCRLSRWSICSIADASQPSNQGLGGLHERFRGTGAHALQCTLHTLSSLVHAKCGALQRAMSA